MHHCREVQCPEADDADSVPREEDVMGGRRGPDSPGNDDGLRMRGTQWRPQWRTRWRPPGCSKEKESQRKLYSIYILIYMLDGDVAPEKEEAR